jgi:hypothetical protein
MLLPLAMLWLTACGTLDVNLYHEPTTDFTGTQTLQALQTQNALLESTVATLRPSVYPLSMESSSDDIQLSMLQSAGRWSTIWVDGALTDKQGGGGVTRRQQVWIDQTGARFRFVSGTLAGKVERLIVSDGLQIMDMDVLSGSIQSRAVPQGAAGQLEPTLDSGDASPNPLWAPLGAGVPQMIFPSDYARNTGGYKPLSLDTVAGRGVLEVEWTYVGNQLPTWRAWLDRQTGVILKMQYFGKGGGEQAQSEDVVQEVRYDMPNLPDALFDTHLTAQPFFSDMYGNKVTTETPGPATPAGRDPLGSLYFLDLTPEEGFRGSKLVRLPASCVAGKLTCPEPEKIGLPENTRLDRESTLVWSADGQQAALATHTDAGYGVTQLYTSKTPIQSWKSIAQYYSIDILAWSRDGNWISFRGSDGKDNEDYYIVRPDGTGLKNVTANPALPAEGRPYILDGWTTNQLVVHSGIPGRETAIYLVGANDGLVKLVKKLPLEKAIFYASPDGSLLAFNGGTVLRMMALDGSGERSLAVFQTTIYPIAWAPDSGSLAFALYGDNNQAPSQSRVYLINRDGSGLRQVYTGADVASLSFSPDGKYLLVGSGIPQHIFVVDVSSMDLHILLAPGLSLLDDWCSPAWLP